MATFREYLNNPNLFEKLDDKQLAIANRYYRRFGEEIGDNPFIYEQEYLNNESERFAYC